MKTPRTRVARTVADTTLKSGVTRPYSRKLAAYLLAERRVNELHSLLRDVQADWAEAGQVEVIAHAAHPLTTTIKADITKRVKQLYPKAQKIMITEVHDQTVIGGVRLELPNQQFDGTVQAKLNKFKQLTSTGKD